MLNKIRQIAQSTYNELGLTHNTTECKCAIACTALYKNILHKLGITGLLYCFSSSDGSSHCALGIMHDKELYIVDITFTQFDPRVTSVLIEEYFTYVDRLIRTNMIVYNGEKLKIKSTYDLKHFKQYFLRYWPEDQKPIL